MNGLHALDLGIARGGVRLLSAVSFTVGAGDVLVLRGPNGVGKTSLLRCLAGLQAPLEGRIEGALDNIAYAGHPNGIKPTLSVAENLQFWARVFGRADITAALDAYALARLQDRAAGALSAGQARRLSLARLMVTGRPIWILDEPTVALDTAAVMMFAEVIRTHLAGGGSAVIATHIDLGLPEAAMLDLSNFRARPMPSEEAPL